MSKLILKKLIFIGTDKEPAIIDFKPGFNVISGPSDTGKSLIFECINYVLGGSSTPKEPPEAKGYTNIFLTITAGDIDFTIERSILTSDLKLYKVAYDNITSDTKHEVLSGKADARNSISNYLLSIVGIKDKKLKRNESNEVNSLTFNVLRNLLLVDEGKIQTKSSPIFTGVPTSETSEKSLFRFMLTGIDYSNIIVQVKPAIRKADATARINILKQLINNNSLNIKKDATKEELEDQLAKLEKSIEDEVTKISTAQNEIEKLQEDRKAAWETSISADSKTDQLKEMLSRFNLLVQHYQTDLNRLEAIIETGEVLSHTADIHCPLCGSDHKYHRPECVISETEIDKIKISCEYEKQKINSLKNDLAKTISEVNSEVQDFTTLKQNNETEYKRIDKLLSEKMEPTIFRQKNYLRELFDTRKDVEIMIITLDQVKLMEDLKSVAEEDLKPRPKNKKVPAGVQTSEASDFLKVIENVLKDWGYPNLGLVSFSESQQDITIGNKNRADQGKGYRAITHAAFIISLMQFCIDKNMPHPGFVVLDSPLVTFRAADKKIESSDAVPDDMKKKFYSTLCNLSKDRQVIVIENDDPPEGVSDKINYIPFTKNSTLGRSGFIPSGKG